MTNPANAAGREARACHFDGRDYSEAQLAAAQAVACRIVLRYGEGGEREQEAGRAGWLWNDHPAVQAALLAGPALADEAASQPREGVVEQMRHALTECLDQMWHLAQNPSTNPWVKEADAALAAYALHDSAPTDQAQRGKVDSFALARLSKMADHGRIDAAYGDFSHPAVTMIADVRKVVAALAQSGKGVE